MGEKRNLEGEGWREDDGNMFKYSEVDIRGEGANQGRGCKLGTSSCVKSPAYSPVHRENIEQYRK
jgi:hypothetical protein